MFNGDFDERIEDSRSPQEKFEDDELQAFLDEDDG